MFYFIMLGYLKSPNYQFLGSKWILDTTGTEPSV